jgi:molecular chaperone GrpE
MRMPDDITDREAAPSGGEAADAAALQAENEQLRDRMLRALADAENARRRAERSATEARQSAVADVVRELLPAADNLQRAIAAAEQHGPTGDAALIEGVRATERMLMGVLERFGVRKIEALGARFDPHLHEAVMETDDHDHPPATVVGVVEDGYTIGDRLLRPARVIVAKQRADAPTSPSARSHYQTVDEHS